MKPLEAAMMTAEVLSNPMHAGALLILSPPDDADSNYVADLYNQGLADDVEIDPRLRRCAHRGVDTLGMWAWRYADNIDLNDHFQRRTLPAAGGERALWDLVAALHGERLDRQRPLWMAYLIDGLPDGRFAFYVKVHHTVVDGVAGLQMINRALTTDPTRRFMKPFYAAAPHEPVDRITHTRTPFLDPASALSSAANAATSAIGFTRKVVTGEASYLFASLAERKTVLPFSAPFTRFNRRLGRERAVAGATLSKERIQAVQDAAGASRNDVLMAVVSGVLRSWLDAHHELPMRSLVAFCPITVRASGSSQAEDGNLFGLELCPLGTDSTDPAKRLTTIHRSMEWAKQQVARRGSDATTLLAAPSIAPTVLGSLIPFGPRWRTGYNVPISNVRGPDTEMYFNGAHLEFLYPVSTVYDGQALNVTMCPYADRIGVGYVAGRDVVPDIESFVALTEDSMAELETAHGLSR
jgi:diacylglycerol O-acyltransferase